MTVHVENRKSEQVRDEDSLGRTANPLPRIALGFAPIGQLGVRSKQREQQPHRPLGSMADQLGDAGSYGGLQSFARFSGVGGILNTSLDAYAKSPTAIGAQIASEAWAPCFRISNLSFV